LVNDYGKFKVRYHPKEDKSDLMKVDSPLKEVKIIEIEKCAAMFEIEV